MDRDLLRLILVNHALHVDVDHDVAWPLVDDILDGSDVTDVRVLADRVREAAVERVHGASFSPDHRLLVGDGPRFWRRYARVGSPG